MAKNGTKVSPGDQTGKMKVKLQEDQMKEQQDAAKNMAMATAAAQKVVSDEVVDYTEAKPKVVADNAPKVLDGTPETKEADPVETDPVIAAAVAKSKKQPAAQEVGGVVDKTEPTIVGEDRVKVKALHDLTNCVIGAGTSYTFEQGRTYIVNSNVARHLGERGYLVEVR